MHRLMILLILLFAANAQADTVYLKNGGVVEGIVEKEDADKVEVDMGFGTATFEKRRIKNIERASPKDNGKITEKWEDKKKELNSKVKEFERAREKRFGDAYKNWMDEEREKKSGKGESKDVGVMRDESGRHIIAEVLLNDKVKAVLLVDTGASIIVLSKRIGEALGLDMTDTTKDVMTLELADGSKKKAKAIVLDSVKVGDVESKKVMAAVMLEQIEDPSLKDGLLGMSFLGRFNIKMDLKTMKMSLEKLGNQEEAR